MTAVERAIELARNSSCRSVADIKRTLTRERFEAVEQHLAGASIKKQLAGLIAGRGTPEEG